MNDLVMWRDNYIKTNNKLPTPRVVYNDKEL